MQDFALPRTEAMTRTDDELDMSDFPVSSEGPTQTNIRNLTYDEQIKAERMTMADRLKFIAATESSGTVNNYNLSQVNQVNQINQFQQVNQITNNNTSPPRSVNNGDQQDAARGDTEGQIIPQAPQNVVTENKSTSSTMTSTTSEMLSSSTSSSSTLIQSIEARFEDIEMMNHEATNKLAQTLNKASMFIARQQQQLQQLQSHQALSDKRMEMLMLNVQSIAQHVGAPAIKDQPALEDPPTETNQQLPDGGLAIGCPPPDQCGDIDPHSQDETEGCGF